MVTIDPSVEFREGAHDGDRVEAGMVLAEVTGRAASILAAERVALNFMQHLSGVASLTRRFVDAVRSYPCQILDTRKTIPGFRVLEKYAVRCGGGHNHRMGLYDAVLIKDNHLAALDDWEAIVHQAIARIRHQDKPQQVTIEVDRFDQLDRALRCRPDVVLLDNMTTEMLARAVRRRNQTAPHILLEASGGISLSNVQPVAAAGVDRISVGALTHSAPALDISLDYQSS
jgi:nicotinate-nucleotide pyrophosphorylase (carboxylating)